MGNKFDMISANESGSINNLNLLNETFHVFSKSPASNVTTLGGARMKSGHTTTTSDVWADAIPAFFNAANQTKFDYFSTLAEKDDLCIFDGKVYQHNGTEFVSLGTIDEVLTDGKEFSKNNRSVIKYHKNRPAINLTADNNNGDGANNLSARIYDAAEGSTNFVPQFISSTDKMVGGVPSLSYDASVVAGGVKLAEGLTNDNDYICNAYAGVIQFNKERSSGVTVSAWEYIGAKLDATVARLTAAVFGSNDDETGEQPTDLVTQVNRNTAAITLLNAADTETGSIANSIKTAINKLGDVAVKGDITITDIKVKVGSGDANSLTIDENKSVTIEIPEVPVATVTGGVIADGDNDKFVKAGDAKAIAEKAISVSLEDVNTTGAIGKAIADAKKEALDAIGGIYHFNVKVVDALPTSASELVENTIYLVPDEDKTSGNYVEYIAYKPEGSETVTTERIGTTAVDLEGYTTDAEYEALAGETGRVTVVEGKVETLEKTTIPAIQKSVTDGVAEAKAYASSELAAARTEISAETTALSEVIASNKSTIEQTVSALSTTVKDTTDALDGRLTNAETAINALTDGDASVANQIEAAAKAIKDQSLVQTGTLSGMFTVQTAGTVGTGITNISISDAGLSAAITKAKTDAEATAADALSEARGQITTEISDAVSGLESKLTTGEGSLGAKVTALETATGETLPKAIQSAQDTADEALGIAETAVQTVKVNGTALTKDGSNAVDITALTAVDTTATGSNGITIGETDKKVTLTVTPATYTPASEGTAGSWTNDEYFAKAADIATAISDAKSGAEQTAATALSTARGQITTEISDAVSGLESKLTTGEGSLGAKVTALETATTTTLPNAIEQALEDAKAYSDSLHTTSLDYVVLGDSESLPTASADTLGKIYLVASQNAPTADGSAISGSYVEYMTRKVGEGETATYTWEKIGTTAVDLADYAKTSEVEEAIATATQTTTLVSEGALAAPATGDENKFVTASGIYTAITTAKSEVISSLEVTASGSNGITLDYADGALTLEVSADAKVTAGSDNVVTSGAVATAITEAVEALDVEETTQNGITFSQTDGKVAISVAVGAVEADNTSVVTGGAVATAITGAVEALDATETVNGITVTQVDGVITGITEELIVASVPADTTSVEGNVAYVGSEKHVIAPEKFQTAAKMPETLTSWVADLSNLTVGDNMFNGCTGLTTFIGDLSSLTSGVDMFTGCSLTVESVEFIADTLPTVTSGTITLGNRTDAHNDAVAEIEAKGWTVA